MEYNERQRSYILQYLKANLGSSTTVSKEDIIDLAKELNIELRKNAGKAKAIESIVNSGYEDKLYQTFAEFVEVPFWELHKQYNISYKVISDLEQLEVIKALGHKGKKDTTLYPIDALGFADGELQEIWDNKYKTNFHRTRVEVQSEEEVQGIVDQLATVFEIENVSKLYEHRESNGYYVYLSIRPTEGSAVNQDNLSSENARLKLDIAKVKAEFKEYQDNMLDQQQKLRVEQYNRIREFDEEIGVKQLEIKRLQEELEEAKLKIQQQEQQQQQVEQEKEQLQQTLHDVVEIQLEDTKEQLQQVQQQLQEQSGEVTLFRNWKNNLKKGGRKKKFSEADKFTIRMEYIQGKSIRAIAKEWGCSPALVHGIIHENDKKK